MYKGKCTILLSLKCLACFYWLNYIYLSDWGQVYPSCFGAFLALFRAKFTTAMRQFRGSFIFIAFFDIFTRVSRLRFRIF